MADVIKQPSLDHQVKDMFYIKTPLMGMACNEELNLIVSAGGGGRGG